MMKNMTAPTKSTDKPIEEREADYHYYDDDDECWQCGGDGGWPSCMEDTCPAEGGEEMCLDPMCWTRCDVCRGRGAI